MSSLSVASASASSLTTSTWDRSESPSVSSVPQVGAAANYSRISCLLMVEGTKCAEETVLARLPENKSLAQILEENQTKLQKLMTKRVLTKPQYDILFPFDGNSSKIDITLWLVLARNVTDKKLRRNIDWSRSPKKEEILWGHDLIRLKEIRNHLFHIGRAELEDKSYNKIITTLIDVLRRLGTSDRMIEYHLDRDLDPQKTKISELQIKEQYLQEQNLLFQKIAKQKNTNWIICTVLSVLAFLAVLSVFSGLMIKYYKKKSCTQSLDVLKSSFGGVPYMSRSGWDATAVKNQDSLKPLKRPIQKVSVHHTANVAHYCDDTELCCEQVKNTQDLHINQNGFTDIGYNYLIGNDGVVYEGRGTYVGAAVWGTNSQIISIGMLGNYVCTSPSSAAMTALYSFLEYATYGDPSTGQPGPILAKNYTLYGHCQLNVHSKEHEVIFPDSPGAGIMQKIMHWDHWDSHNLTECSYCKDCLTTVVCNAPSNRTRT